MAHVFAMALWRVGFFVTMRLLSALRGIESVGTMSQAANVRIRFRLFGTCPIQCEPGVNTLAKLRRSCSLFLATLSRFVHVVVHVSESRLLSSAHILCPIEAFLNTDNAHMRTAGFGSFCNGQVPAQSYPKGIIKLKLTKIAYNKNVTQIQLWNFAQFLLLCFFC